MSDYICNFQIPYVDELNLSDFNLNVLTDGYDSEDSNGSCGSFYNMGSFDFSSLSIELARDDSSSQDEGEFVSCSSSDRGFMHPRLISESAEFAELEDVIFSSDEESVESGSAESPSKKRIKNRKFSLLKSFDNKALFDKWFSGEKSKWRKGPSKSIEKGDVDNYYCEYSRKQGYARCLSGLRVVFDAESEHISVEISSDDHEHKLIAENKLTDEIKEFIKARMNNMNAKPIYNELTYCESKRIAEHEDAATVYASILEEGEEQKIMIFWSTPRLIEYLKSQPYLQIDSTHKIVYVRFPVQPLGTSNVNHRFIPTGLAISSVDASWAYQGIFDALKSQDFIPAEVLGDACKALTKAAQDCFPESGKGMCFFHVKVNVSKALHSLDNAKEFDADIFILQICLNKGQFAKASGFMIEYWKVKYQGNKEALNFIEYFKANWLDKNSGWYIGCPHHTRSTHTFRRRMPLRDFLKKAEEIVEQYSRDVKNNPMSDSPYIPLKEYDAAYSLHQQVKAKTRPLAKYRLNHVLNYIMPAKENVAAEKNEYVRWMRLFLDNQFTSWEEYRDNRLKFHLITPNNVIYKCTCPVAIKKKPCKHTTMLMVQDKLLQYPPSTLSKPIEQKRKRGRPSKAIGAWTRD